MTIKGLKIASKLIGPVIFISYFKANFATYKNDQRPRINLNLQVCYIVTKVYEKALQ